MIGYSLMCNNVLKCLYCDNIVNTQKKSRNSYHILLQECFVYYLIACACNISGTANEETQCDNQDGQCPCQSNYGGRQCADCSLNYYNYDAGCLRKFIVSSNQVIKICPFHLVAILWQS